MIGKILKYLLIINLSLTAIFIFSRLYFIHKFIHIIFKAFIVPLILSVFIFYIFKPLNEIFKEKGLRHEICALLSLAIISFIASGIIYCFSNYLIYQLKNIFRDFSTIFDKKIYSNNLINEIDKFINVDDLYSYLIKNAENYVNLKNFNIIKLGNYATHLFSKILLIIIILFYLLKDGDKFKDKVLLITPKTYKDYIGKILTQSDEVLSSYVTGQAKVALSLSALIFAVYVLLGIPNALLLAFTTFILAFIPFIGFFISMIVPLIIALSISWLMFLKLSALFLLVQSIKGRLIVPAIMAHTMKIHPLTDIILVIGAVSIGGWVAAFVIVPIYAILKTCWANRSIFKSKI